MILLRRTRRRFRDGFKAKIALEALRGDQTLSQIAARHKLHPNQISQWKRQDLDGLLAVFSRAASPASRRLICIPRLKIYTPR